VGVIPEFMIARELAFRDADELITVDTMRERKRIMEERAAAFLTLPGGIGTLEELLEVWVAGTLGMHDKPVVVLDPGGVLAGLRDLVDRLVAQGFVRPAAAAGAVWTSTVAEAVDAVEAGVAAARRGAAHARPLAEEVLEAEA
ncbi:MAG: TIGR00730 family Rossman fold protein, partial [Actinobacteria bacterium]|nr:TIGR00730 family Rossman fold protein [Actinomycetota bacterium]